MAPGIVNSLEQEINGTTPIYVTDKLSKDAVTYPEPQSRPLDPGKPHTALKPDDHSALFQNSREPLAVTGFAFTLPQEATSVQDFWRILLEKRCVMSQFPEDRVNIDAFYHPDTNRSDSVPFRGGHFLGTLPSAFDAPFFTITAAEAEAMDPQQRVLLETTYHALENAGIPLEEVSGSRTSVHVGCSSDDYKSINLRSHDFIPIHSSAGLAMAMLSNRVSWFYNLLGPSMSIDTACSSSMVALDVACQGLQNGETDMALVGGINTILDIDSSITLSRMNFASTDSLCRSFDSRGKGYSRAEGFGVMVVKRMSDALKANDTIRAVIRATGSNQDGRTPGITQPSRDSQERLIRETYSKVNLDMDTTRYCEAHGTGTAVGDPIEANAIGNAFRSARNSADPMYIGAVKSNVGHLEGASGIAGLIKTIMVLEKGIIPPNANFEILNPGIDADYLNLKFPTKSTPWPSQGLRRASISNFGFGGSNTHVILDDAYNFLRLRGLKGNHWTLPQPPSLAAFEESYHTSMVKNSIQTTMENLPKSKSQTQKTALLVWSASDRNGVTRVAESLRTIPQETAGYLGKDSADAYLQNIVYTLSKRRSMLSWRSFTVVESLSDLETLPTKMSKPVRAKSNPKLGYVFTGQGAQYATMSETLLRFPVFRDSLRKSEMYLNEMGCQWFLIDELLKPEGASSVNDAAYSQPLCTALQIGIVDLLRTLNTEPLVAIGHSSGEIAAAYAIGAISHQSACKIAYFRGKCAAELEASVESRGAMMSVGLSDGEIEPYFNSIRSHFGSQDINVACKNSPRNLTISGKKEQIDWLKSILDRENVFARVLKVKVPYHSPFMKAIAPKYLSMMGQLEAGEPQKTSLYMISSVTGARISAADVQTAQYWVDNMVNPVLFTDAIQRLCSTPKSGLKRSGAIAVKATVTELLEIGPDAALRRPIRDTLEAANAQDVSYLSTLSRSSSASLAFLDAMGKLSCSGHHVDILQANTEAERYNGRHIALPNLPSYSFDHSQSYWNEGRFSKDGYRLRKHPRVDLLGTTVPDWNELEPRWRNFLRVPEQPWIQDHKVNGAIMYPAAGMLVMALEATKQLYNGRHRVTGYKLSDTAFPRGLIVPPDAKGVEYEFIFRPTKGKGISWDFVLLGYLNERWQECCTGSAEVEVEEPTNDIDNGKEALAFAAENDRLFELTRRNCREELTAERIYNYFSGQGLDYGPAFRGIQGARYDGDTGVLANVQVFQWSSPGNGEPQPHIIHPATLDAVLQTAIIALSNGTKRDLPAILPTRLGKLWVRADGVNFPQDALTDVVADATMVGPRKARTEYTVADVVTGSPMLKIEESEGTLIGSADSRRAFGENSSPCYSWDWKADLDLLSDQELSGHCEGARAPRTDDSDFYQGLGFALLMHMSEALQNLPQNNLRKPASHLDHYTEWMQRWLGYFHDGRLPHLSPDHPKWKRLSTNEHSRRDHYMRLESTAQGSFFLTLGRNLLSVLKGEVDPQALFDENNLTSRFDQVLSEQIIDYGPLTQYLDLLIHKNPSLKVLEVGAGSGTLTNHILDALNAHDEDLPNTLTCSQYDFTDISGEHLISAAEKFAQYGEKIKYFALDIEKDPAQQDVADGTYDVIIAGSVLHATKNLKNTMHHVRKLLKPGGKIIFLEMVYYAMRASFAFGLLPEWWSSEEKERHLAPWVTTDAWDEALRDSGFSGIDLEIRDYVDDACHEYSFLISTATASQENSNGVTPNSEQSPLILTTDTELQTEIGAQLKQELKSRHSFSPEVTSLAAVAERSDLQDRTSIFLHEVDTAFVAGLDAEKFTQLKRVLTTAPRILWVTSGGGNGEGDPRLHLIDGLSRTALTETPQLELITLALEAKYLSPLGATEKILRVFDQSLADSADDFEPEYREKDDRLCISRVSPASRMSRSVQSLMTLSRTAKQEFGEGPPLALRIGTLGLLDSLHFVEDATVDNPLAPGEIEVEVNCAGVNFRDCLTVLGQLETTFLGLECSGIVHRAGRESGFKPGDRVAAMFRNSFQTYTRGPADFAVKLPENISFAEASSIPITYVTAWYCVHVMARLQPRESILIHAGAGGTGQAAIQVAKYIGANIFVTVSSTEKKKLMVERYGIDEKNIFYSRNTSFVSGIMRETNGRGVDVVLNSLSGKELKATWACIGPLGRFVEIGTRDILSHNQLPMWQFRKSCAYCAFDLPVLASEQPSLVRESLAAVMRLLSEKILSPPSPIQTLGISEISEALRLFQSGKVFGKMIIEMRKHDLVQATIATKHSYNFSATNSYLIVGGTGGLGRDIARWMVQRGARYLILLSRSGTKSQTAKQLTEELAALDVQVACPACDVNNRESLSVALEHCTQTMPPVKGCIQAAMILRDITLKNMSFEDWATACEPKVQGTWNLHQLLPRGMDFFICLSSISSIIGNGGQANYAAANTYMDEFVYHRARHQEKATTINLGWVNAEGAVAENVALKAFFENNKFFKAISIAEVHALLEYYCDPNLSIDTASSQQVITGLNIPSGDELQLRTVPWTRRRTSRRWAQLIQDKSLGSANAIDEVELANDASLFREAPTFEDAARVVVEGLVRMLTKALGVPAEDVDTSKPLHALGVDSLLAIELRNFFQKELDADVAIFDIMGAADLSEVGMLVTKASQARA
ncbi:reducing type I polyketide synthase [Viridothelium virens]|uniref:Reducing type I polyketide synthase n=1 Tax=Viridothelium virens TaxID=1048519 RepID=A0A6A6HPI4_VIRVR|nr:reducing type I polyketide synthase [Viridothelium virens]